MVGSVNLPVLLLVSILSFWSDSASRRIGGKFRTHASNVKEQTSLVISKNVKRIYFPANFNFKKRLPFAKRNYTGRAYIVRCCGKKSCNKPPKFPPNKQRSSWGKINPRGPQKRPVQIDGKLYMIPKEKGDFEDAKQECSKNNLEMTKVGGGKEHENFNDYLKYIGVSTDVVFTALDKITDGNNPFKNASSTASPPVQSECKGLLEGEVQTVSCNAKSHFACEGPMQTKGEASLLPIDEAPLSYINGKNYLIPSDKVTEPEAEGLCAKKGMGLMSLETLAETNAVQDFLADVGLSTSSVITSLKKISGEPENSDGADFNWLGGVASNFLKWAPDQPPATGGECAALDSFGLKGITCDTVSNFVCEAPGDPLKKPDDPLNSLQSITLASAIDIGGQQYLLPSEKASFQDAKAHCETRSMKLISLETQEESTLVQDYLSKIGLSDTPIMTSLKQSEGKWGSGAPLENLKWDKGGVGDCAAFCQTLYHSHCDAEINFMCEASTNTETAKTQDAPAPQAPSADSPPEAAAAGVPDNLPVSSEEPVTTEAVITTLLDTTPTTINPVTTPHLVTTTASTLRTSTTATSTSTIISTTTTTARITTSSTAPTTSTPSTSTTVTSTSSSTETPTTTTITTTTTTPTTTSSTTSTPTTTTSTTLTTTTTSSTSVVTVATTTVPTAGSGGSNTFLSGSYSGGSISGGSISGGDLNFPDLSLSGFDTKLMVI